MLDKKGHRKSPQVTAGAKGDTKKLNKQSAQQ
jgi:hypothetical protein